MKLFFCSCAPGSVPSREDADSDRFLLHTPGPGADPSLFLLAAGSWTVSITVKLATTGAPLPVRLHNKTLFIFMTDSRKRSRRRYEIIFKACGLRRNVSDLLKYQMTILAIWNWIQLLNTAIYFRPHYLSPARWPGRTMCLYYLSVHAEISPDRFRATW